ncbi:MAG: aminoglycoside phosphotransferase family protein [Clostridiales bacterium]|jgi:serine/threonine protein kinase|nr:aminoglycoside phosphotransferase family protein [Clostridiales bacterium]
MEKTVQQIVERHKDLFGENPAIGKINAGFTNAIFSIADKYVLKICRDAENEREFKSEISFYLESGEKDYIPKFFAYSQDKAKIPFYYIVTEKLKGHSLYDIWHTFTEREREDAVIQICDILKDFHKKKGEPFDWSEYIKGYCRKHLAILEEREQLTSDEFAVVLRAMKKFDFYLKSKDFVFIHNDMHFDNLFCVEGKIKVIDFESCRFNPIDKELEIFYYMAQTPWKHAGEENEKFVKIEDYKTLIPYMRKYYPEIFNVPYLEQRMAIYHLRDALDQYGTYTKEKELHERILRLAEFITDTNG